jgi:hypothetical protein
VKRKEGNCGIFAEGFVILSWRNEICEERIEKSGLKRPTAFFLDAAEQY